MLNSAVFGPPDSFLTSQNFHTSKIMTIFYVGINYLFCKKYIGNHSFMNILVSCINITIVHLAMHSYLGRWDKHFIICICHYMVLS